MWQELSIKYQFPGLDSSKNQEVHRWPFPEMTELPLPLQDPNFQEFEFLEVDEAAKTIRMKKGEWILDRPLIIPKEYAFNIHGGSKLMMKDNACMIIYGNCNWSGSKNSPIEISGPEDGKGNGILLMDSQSHYQSFFSQVIFSCLSPPAAGNWSLSGGFNVYESNVVFQHCQWLNGKGEDGINLIRSDFVLEYCDFRHSEGDALDIDFGGGKVRYSNIYHSGNDALDVSGSFVEMKRMDIQLAGDKGISIGEKQM